jgi:YidC/Oxa1 family membrane protein insertase
VDPFLDALAAVLAFFYDLVPNYAVAIILLTLVVMIIVTPLTLKGTRSMMVMQQLQPEMRKIQQKYKDDRQKLNEELLKFYKENEINPLGGCLPLLVQMPIFIVLYQVLRGLTRRVSDLGFDVGWVSGQVATGQGATEPGDPIRTFDPAYVNQDTQLYQDLRGSTQMDAFGMDLAESASQAMSAGIIHALPFLILIAVVAVTGFVQQKQIQGRNPNAQINPQQQMLMRVLPIFLPIISFGLPAGLVLYFAVSNLYRIGQQAFISRSIYGIRRNGEDGKDGKRPKGGPDRGGKGGKVPAGKAAAGTDDDTDLDGAVDETPKGRATPKRGAKSAKSTKKVSTNARSQKSNRAGGRSRGGGNGQEGAPTLQPRARKNKKR